MLTDVIFPQHRRFKSRTEWEPIGFFSEALCNSVQFDLKLGFFSSSAINVLSDGFAVFLYNGGKMRMIINDILANDDKQAMIAGESDVTLPYFDLQDIEGIHNVLSERNKHFFECISWLIRNERLEFKIVQPKDGIGIAHSKCGVFTDGLNKVAFDGSCNFSQTALISNIENITAFCNWDSESDIYKINDIAEDFERTFSGSDDAVKYLSINQVKDTILNTFENKEIKELLEDEIHSISQRISKDYLSDCIKSALERTKAKLNNIIEKKNTQLEEVPLAITEPRFPYEEPREYQVQAYNNWKNNKQKGLFAMATGTGKTITSLNCLLEIYKHNGYYKAIILVPTITLVEQWEKECRKFNFTHIYKVSSKNPQWKEEIMQIQICERLSDNGKNCSYIIIATYASFARRNVFAELNKFPRNKVLLIADEAHNMGAGQMKKRLSEINYLRRIGLSATPDRKYDEEGNEAINQFFGVSDKYTFEYKMEEAIKNSVLCKYYYYPHLIHLTDIEMDKYVKLSEKIAKYISTNKNAKKPNDSVLTGMLLKRKRIIHKAANKKAVFQHIMMDRFKEKGSLKYTLVYVPEGNEPENESDVFTTQDIIKDDEFTDSLIDKYSEIIRSVNDKVTVRKFTSMSKDRDVILTDFAKGNIDVLTSMKCLDEGVDVPRSEMAVFCASTGNPRQFIQRRGRILRKHPDKHIAIIHDLVVAPRIDTGSVSFNLEKKQLEKELERVRDFAFLSENSIDSIVELNDIMKYYEVSLFKN